MKRAFTLIELLVYMMIMSFVIVVAGRVFSDSTKMRVRSQNMVKNSEEVGRISELIKEDVLQMGTKAYGDKDASNNYQVKVDQNVYMEPPNDYSSYKLNAGRDNLFFRKMAFKPDGSYDGVREINWYLKDRNIYRSCKTVSGTQNAECPTDKPETVLMGSNINRLEFFPSKPGISPSSATDILFTSNIDDEFSFLPQQSNNNDIVSIGAEQVGNNTVVVSGIFDKNPQTGGGKKAVLCLEEAGQCRKFELFQGETYAIEFEMPFVRDEYGDSISTQFLLGEDHLAVGLRQSDYPTLAMPPDVLIYPPQSHDNLLRHIEFTIPQIPNPENQIPPPEKISASIALTFAFYSPKAHQGTLRFKNFNVFRKSDEAFHFPKDEPDYGTEAADISKKYEQKKNAKAFEMILELEHKGEKSGTFTKDEKGEKGMVILTPNNGISAVGSSL